MPFSLESLPEEDEQDWLLECLAELIERTGGTPFLQGPLVEPSPVYFPEPWEPDLHGALAITLRLMHLAGMATLDVQLHAFEEESREGLGPPAESGVAAWFAGIKDGVCLFGIRESRLADAEALAGVMAHEVAHAYRFHHGLFVEDRELEERLTDVTTVFLGFGLLTANITYRFQAQERDEWVVTWRESGGYLSCEAMCFLLAAQVALRATDTKLVRRVAALLEREQAYCFRRAYDLLAGEEGLDEVLGIPRSASITEPTAPVLERISLSSAGAPWGRVSFRLRPRRLHEGALLGVLGGMVLAMGARRAGLSIPVGLGVIPLSVALGVGVASLMHKDSCACCGVPLSPVALECPGCFGALIGIVRQPIAGLGEGSHLGEPVFRIRSHRAREFGLRGLAWGFLLAMGASSFTSRVEIGLMLLLGSVGVSALIGALIPRDRCSTPDCDTILEPFMARCPRCLGDIRGNIRQARQRLEAEERVGDLDEHG